MLVSLQSHAEVLNALDLGPGFVVEGGLEGGLGVDEGVELGDHGSYTLRTKERIREDGDLKKEEEENQSKLYIASISPQTLASLSTTLSLPPHQTLSLLNQFLCGPHGLASGGKYNNKFTWLVGTDAARDACLVLGAEEVLAGTSFPGLQSKIQTSDSLQKDKSGNGSKEVSKQIQKPILSSSCPGWICYAEKTHPHILPHLSRLKSPQALTGTLLKTVLSKKYKISPERIWHVAIMPCFDKKLEASREELTDLYWGGMDNLDDMSALGIRKGVRDVDCVITSKEVLMLALTRNIDLLSLPRDLLSQPAFPDATLDRFLFPSKYQSLYRRSKKLQQDPAAGTSGGHLWYILHHISSLHPGSSIQSIRGRNADVIDYTVTSSSGEILFKAARYYGFRNIQNLVRRLKPARASRMPGAKNIAAKKMGAGMEQGYVEVMACPGGCTNGGGQVKVDDPVVSEYRLLSQNQNEAPISINGIAKPGAQEQKDWLAQVDEAYFSSTEDNQISSDENNDTTNNDMNEVDDTVDGISPSYIRDTLAHWATLTGFTVDKLVYTSYREVVSDVGKKVSETERVAQLAGKIGGGW